MRKTSISSDERHGRSAFTLMELLVVVSVIAVLAMLLFPGLSKAREWSQNTKCLNNLRQFGLGIPLYAAEHDGVLYPPCPNGDWFWNGDEDAVGAKRFSSHGGADFAPYVGYALGLPQFSRIGGWNYLLYCPSIRKGYPGVTASGYKNYWGLMPDGILGYAMNVHAFLGSPRGSNFGGNPSRKLLLADASVKAAMQVTYNYPFAASSARHNNRINGLFMDGHVEALTLDEVSRSGAGEKPFADLISKE